MGEERRTPGDERAGDRIGVDSVRPAVLVGVPGKRVAPEQRFPVVGEVIGIRIAVSIGHRRVEPEKTFIVVAHAIVIGVKRMRKHCGHQRHGKRAGQERAPMAHHGCCH
jgi:hypothetical protein